MQLRVVGVGRMLTIHRMFQMRKRTMELIKMRKMESTMEMVSTNNSGRREPVMIKHEGWRMVFQKI